MSKSKKRQGYRRARRRREERALRQDAAPPPPVLKPRPDDGPPRPYHDARHALYAYRKYRVGGHMDLPRHPWEDELEVADGGRWDLGPVSVGEIDEHPLMVALRETVRVLAAMPAPKRPVLALSRLEALQDFNDAYGYTPEETRPAVPSAAAITRADHTLLLFALMREHRRERRALWLRALDHSYRHIADRMSLSSRSVFVKHRAARRLCEDGLWTWTGLIRAAERAEIERGRRPFVAA